MNNSFHLATGSQKELRRINQNRIFRVLFFATRAITRQEICELTGLNLPLVSRVTAEMLEAGFLEEICPVIAAKRRGRRCTALQVKADGAYVISVAITAYSQEVLIGNLKGHIVYNKTLTGFFTLNPQEVEPFLAEVMQNALRDSGIPQERLLGGSLALPRQVLCPRGKESSAPFIDDVLIENLGKKINTKLTYKRLAEVFNLAEATWGVSRNFENVLCLHITYIIGGSLLYKGAISHQPDSIGNITGMPVARSGISTSELARIENIASGMSILKRLGLLSDDRQPLNYTIEDTLNLTLAHTQSLTGNTAAQSAFTDAGEWMGHALETLYHAYHPELIVLSGSLIENPFYTAAMHNAWSSLHPAGTPVETRCGTLSLNSAAILTALHTHVTAHDLDLDYIFQGA